MHRRKIANWTLIREMCRQHFAGHTAEEEVEVRATALARQHAEEEVAAFKREGEVAKEAMEEAADIAVGKMHAAAARKAVEAVVKEAAMAALREIRHEVAMASLEAVSKKDAKVAAAM
jgi:hypothetical protein